MDDVSGKLRIKIAYMLTPALAHHAVRSILMQILQLYGRLTHSSSLLLTS
jgi:hypothetical protein